MTLHFKLFIRPLSLISTIFFAFQLGSNIWTGAWNLFSGVSCVLICSSASGDLSQMKAQGLLLLSIVVTIVNLVNLVILEVNMHISTKTSKPGPADFRKK